MQWTPMEKTKHLYENETFTYPVGMNESYHRLPHFFHQPGNKARARWGQRFGTPEKFDASMKAYYRMITEVDEACSDIYKELVTQGIENETMVIFTTDNGFFHSEHGLSGKVRNMRVCFIVALGDSCATKHLTQFISYSGIRIKRVFGFLSLFEIPAYLLIRLERSITTLRSTLTWQARFWGQPGCRVILSCRVGILPTYICSEKQPIILHGEKASSTSFLPKERSKFQSPLRWFGKTLSLSTIKNGMWSNYSICRRIHWRNTM
jgi:hypothetical protein